MFYDAKNMCRFFVTPRGKRKKETLHCLSKDQIQSLVLRSGSFLQLAGATGVRGMRAGKVPERSVRQATTCRRCAELSRRLQQHIVPGLSQRIPPTEWDKHSASGRPGNTSTV